MQFKNVPISSSVSVAVPANLTPDEEAKFIAGRLAFVNLEELEADCSATLKLWEEGKLIPLESVLADLATEVSNHNGNHA